MKPLDWIVLLSVAAAFAAAFVFVRRRKNTCSGNCASCTRKCR